jgi:plastocyanin
VRTAAPAAVPNAVIDPATSGTISGVVRFTGKAPKPIVIDMAQDPACAAAAAKTPNVTEQYATHNGRVANVFVYVKSGLGSRIYAPPKTPVVLDQRGCRFIPHVIAAMVGQPVEFRNGDPTMHNVHIVPPGSDDATGVDISQPPMAGTERRSFSTAGVMTPVRCNNHPWMEAFLNIANSPFFAISDAQGRFTISGLPPGRYTLAAVQEQMGTRTAQVTVEPQRTAKITFTFSR